MSELQSTIEKAYQLSENEQNILAELIEVFIRGIKSEHEYGTQKKIRRVVGKYNGKYDVPDDIDFCNDEIAKMFGVSD